MSKKNQILDTATRLFMLQGYGNTSMDQVTRESGVSKATVYAHFSNKNSLFAMCLIYYQEQNAISYPSLEKIPLSLTDLKANLKQYLHQAFEFYNNEAVVAMYRLLISEIKQFPQLFELFFGNDSGVKTSTLADYLQCFRQKKDGVDHDYYFLACQILDLVRGASLWAKLVQNPHKVKFYEHPEETLQQIYASVILLIDYYFKEQ